MDQSKDASGVTEDFDLIAFIESGTIARRKVEIYTDHEAGRECERIQDAIDRLGDDDPEADGPLGASTTSSRRAELEREAEPWVERLQASRMVWTVRALSTDDVERAMDEMPPPKMPAPPKENAPQQLQDRWAERVAEFNQAKAKADADRRLVLISYGVLGIETPRGSSDHVTVDQLRALRGRPHGQGWIDKLYTAIDEASSEEVEPPVPTSPGRSTSTRG